MELQEFAGFCYTSDPQQDVCIELGVSVVANTKSEALGLLLAKYPYTQSSDWTIVGGKADNGFDFGFVEVEIENRSSYWG